MPLLLLCQGLKQRTKRTERPLSRFMFIKVKNERNESNEQFPCYCSTKRTTNQKNQTNIGPVQAHPIHKLTKQTERTLSLFLCMTDKNEPKEPKEDRSCSCQVKTNKRNRMDYALLCVQDRQLPLSYETKRTCE